MKKFSLLVVLVLFGLGAKLFAAEEPSHVPGDAKKAQYLNVTCKRDYIKWDYIKDEETRGNRVLITGKIKLNDGKVETIPADDVFAKQWVEKAKKDWKGRGEWKRFTATLNEPKVTIKIFDIRAGNVAKAPHVSKEISFNAKDSMDFAYSHAEVDGRLDTGSHELILMGGTDGLKEFISSWTDDIVDLSGGKQHLDFIEVNDASWIPDLPKEKGTKLRVECLLTYSEK